jgi:hypothetical protein
VCGRAQVQLEVQFKSSNNRFGGKNSRGWEKAVGKPEKIFAGCFCGLGRTLQLN